MFVEPIEVECDELEPLENGVITYSPDTTAPYSVGTNAVYECNSRFRLIGNPMRVCREDGEFDQEPPTCAIIDIPPGGIKNKYNLNTFAHTHTHIH